MGQFPSASSRSAFTGPVLRSMRASSTLKPVKLVVLRDIDQSHIDLTAQFTRDRKHGEH